MERVSFCFIFVLFRLVSEIIWGAMRVELCLLVILSILLSLQGVTSHGVQPLSTIAIDKAVIAIDKHASIKASPSVLGLKVSINHMTKDIFIFSCFCWAKFTRIYGAALAVTQTTLLQEATYQMSNVDELLIA